MPIDAKLPDGTVLRFPDGTDDAVIDRTVRSHMGVKEGPETSIPAPLAETAGALNRGVAGIGDFVVDGVNAGVSLLPEAPKRAFSAVTEPLRAAVGQEGEGLPRPGDVLEKATGGTSGFMEPGLARTIVQEGGEVAGGFIPGAVSAAPDIARQGARVGKKALQEAAPTIEALKERARGLYQEIDDLGIRVNPEPVQRLSRDVARSLKREGHNVRVTPKVQGVIDELDEIAQGNPTISEIDTARKVARQAALSNEPSEQRLGTIAVQKIDDFLNDLPEDQLIGTGAEKVGPLFSEARGFWSRAKKGEIIDDAFRKADLQASGFENGLRIQFRSLLNNKKQLRGFSDEEVSALRKVVKGGSGENFARFLGKFGLEKDQAVRSLMPTVGAGLGATVGGGAGAIAVPAIGTLAQRLATQLTNNNANLASAMVRAGGDANKVIAAYMRNVPKGQRNPEHLAALLLNEGVAAKAIARFENTGRRVVSDAAFLVGFVSGISENDLANGGDDGQREDTQ